jgi:hypothetical protein
VNPIDKFKEMLIKLENVQKAENLTRKAQIFYSHFLKLKDIIDRNFTILDSIKCSLILKDLRIYFIFSFEIESVISSADFSGVTEIEKHIQFVKLVEAKLKKMNEKNFQEAFSSRVEEEFEVKFFLG